MMSPALITLLENMRQHEAFPELLAAINKPPVRPFSPAKAPNLEAAQARWIYESGQRAQYDATVSLLTGKPNPLTEQEG